MVDVGDKAATRREAVALGGIRMNRRALKLLRAGKIPKGDVLAAARIVGIMAAKKTSTLMPLCHPVPLDSVGVSFRFVKNGLLARAEARAEWKTGVEMEALTAVTMALLTVYDMCKAFDRGMEVGPVWLERKSGGRSGDFSGRRPPRTGVGGGRWL
jgi:cyclic pyranopterin phosphate synthase